jgi:aconitate hydratase
VVSGGTDPITTPDELIPSGETSSYRSNPEKLASFTLSRKDPKYVPLAKAIRALAQARQQGLNPELMTTASHGDISSEILAEFTSALAAVSQITPALLDFNPENMGLGTLVFAAKPGDGSAREQAASCQRVLGTWANIAREYATKRYRSNLINWGMLPLLLEAGELAKAEKTEKAEKESSESPQAGAGVGSANGNPPTAAPFQVGDYLFLPNIRQALEQKASPILAYMIREENHGLSHINNKINHRSPKTLQRLKLSLGELTEEERRIILAGCLINHYRPC